MVVLGRKCMEKPQADGEHQVLSISYLASSFLMAGKRSPLASRELGVDRALEKRIIEFSMTLLSEKRDRERYTEIDRERHR